MSGVLSGQGIGGILGGLLGSLLPPPFDIPAIALTAGGSALGSTLGGVASGEPFGKAALGGLESGGIAGLTAGLGDLATGTPIFGTQSPVSNLFGGGGGDVGAAPPTMTGPAPGEDATMLTTSLGPPLTPTASGTLTPPSMGASPGGISAGGNPGNIALQTGAAPDITQALGGATPNATFADLGVGQDVGSMSTGGGDFGSKILDYLKTPSGISTLLGGGVLGAETLMNRGLPSAYKGPLQAGSGQLNAIAAGLNPAISGLNTTGANLSTAGNLNLQAFQTGQLPPGAQSALDEATSAAKASVRSNFAGMNLSGSTQEATALQQIDQNAAVQKFTMMQELVNTGLKEIGAGTTATEAGVTASGQQAADVTAANQIYMELLNANLVNDQATEQALARFAAALAGGGARAAG